MRRKLGHRLFIRVPSKLSSTMRMKFLRRTLRRPSWAFDKAFALWKPAGSARCIAAAAVEVAAYERGTFSQRRRNKCRVNSYFSTWDPTRRVYVLSCIAFRDPRLGPKRESNCTLPTLIWGACPVFACWSRLSICHRVLLSAHFQQTNISSHFRVNIDLWPFGSATYSKMKDINGFEDDFKDLISKILMKKVSLVCPTQYSSCSQHSFLLLQRFRDEPRRHRQSHWAGNGE